MSDNSELVVYTTSNHDSYYLMDYYGRGNSLAFLTWGSQDAAEGHPAACGKTYRITLAVEEVTE